MISKKIRGAFAVIFLLTLLASMTFEQSQALGQSGLVAWWKLDEGAGEAVFDSSGNNYQGTIRGATWITNQGSQGLAFNGASDYVSLPSIDLSTADAITVVASINSDLTEVGFILYHGALGEFNLGNGDLSQETQSLNLNSTYASFSVKLSDHNWYSVQSSSPMKPNTWHQIVGVWVKGDSLKLYVDGVLAGENNQLAALRLYDPGPSFSSSMGIYSQDQWGQQDLFKGQISNVMIFKKALTPQEISAEGTPIDTLQTPILVCSALSSTSISDFKIQIRGNLTCDGVPISMAPILLSYSVNGGKSWVDLSLVQTSLDGNYYAEWRPSVTGYYSLKAVFEENENYSTADAIVNFAVEPFQEQEVFTVKSNSTLTALSFDSNHRELSFGVSGESGTTGYVYVTIPKSLLSDISTLKVYLDDTQLEYSAQFQGDAWLVYFTYSHSSHVVNIGLGTSVTQVLGLGLVEIAILVFMAIIVAVTIVVAVVVLRKQHNTKKRDFED